jgi:hypothetical protein
MAPIYALLFIWTYIQHKMVPFAGIEIEMIDPVWLWEHGLVEMSEDDKLWGTLQVPHGSPDQMCVLGELLEGGGSHYYI